MQSVRNDRIRAKMTAKRAEAGSPPSDAQPADGGGTERKRLSLKFGG